MQALRTTAVVSFILFLSSQRHVQADINLSDQRCVITCAKPSKARGALFVAASAAGGLVAALSFYHRESLDSQSFQTAVSIGCGGFSLLAGLAGIVTLANAFGNDARILTIDYDGLIFAHRRLIASWSELGNVLIATKQIRVTYAEHDHATRCENVIGFTFTQLHEPVWISERALGCSVYALERIMMHFSQNNWKGAVRHDPWSGVA